MVMDSASDPNSLEVVVDEVDANGDPIIAIVRKEQGSVEFHTLASFYGKDKSPKGRYLDAHAWMKRHLENGDIQYLNRKKAPSLSARAGTVIPTGKEARRYNDNIRFETALVNERADKPVFYDRGTVKRGSVTSMDGGQRLATLFQSPVHQGSGRRRGAKDRPQDISAGKDGRTELFENDAAHWSKGIARALQSNRLAAPLRVLRKSAVLAEFGEGMRLLLQPGAFTGISEKHGDVPQNVWENLPELIADPLYVYPLRRIWTRQVVPRFPSRLSNVAMAQPPIKALNVP